MMSFKRICAAAIALLTILCTGCGAPKKTNNDHFAMGTYITITVNNTRYAKYADECFEYIDSLESQVSTTLQGSQVYRLNTDGEGVLDGDVAEIITSAKYVNDLSGGAFNIAILPLQQLWDIDNREDGDTPPTAEQIAEKLPLLDRVYIQPDKGVWWASAGKGAGIHLGGIAKGYAGDKCAEILRENKVDDAVINLGGNVRTVGDREFRIGLRNPRGDANDLYGVVTVGETNVITSGDYERYFETDGILYHHIFDPTTGYPAKSGLMSATVIGGDGAIADALSTAIFVMGQEEGLELAVSMGYEAIVVTDDYEVYATDGIKPALEITNDRFKLQ